eukprot:gene3028-5038_t
MDFNGIFGIEIEDQLLFQQDSFLDNTSDFKEKNIVNQSKMNQKNNYSSIFSSKTSETSTFHNFDFLEEELLNEEDIIYSPGFSYSPENKSTKPHNNITTELEKMLETQTKKIERPVHFETKKLDIYHDDTELNFESLLDYDQQNLKTNLQIESPKHQVYSTQSFIESPKHVIPISFEDILESPVKNQHFQSQTFSYHSKQEFRSPREEFPINFEQMLDETPTKKIERPVHFKLTSTNQEDILCEGDDFDALSFSIDQYQIGLSIKTQQLQQRQLYFSHQEQPKVQFDEKNYSYHIEQQIELSKKKKKTTAYCGNCGSRYRYTDNNDQGGLCGKCFSLKENLKKLQEEEEEEEFSDSSDDLCLSETIVDEDESQIIIPQKLHKYCIGTGGESVNKIKSETGCNHIHFYQDGSVQLLGERKDRKQAIRKLVERLEDVGWIYENDEWIESKKFDQIWKTFRQEARKQYELRNYYREEAKNAYNEGDHESAEKFKEDSKIHQLKFKVESEIAAKRIFEEVNKKNDLFTIDLHGLFVEEALEFVEKRLEDVSDASGEILTIITGAGRHSKEEKAILKPKIGELLSKRSLYYFIKEGRIKVMCE